MLFWFSPFWLCILVIRRYCRRFVRAMRRYWYVGARIIRLAIADYCEKVLHDELVANYTHPDLTTLLLKTVEDMAGTDMITDDSDM